MLAVGFCFYFESDKICFPFFSFAGVYFSRLREVNAVGLLSSLSLALI